jgi:hypothetical protein
MRCLKAMANYIASAAPPGWQSAEKWGQATIFAK